MIHLSTAKEAALEAGKILLACRGRLTLSKKKDGSCVTNADLAAEKKIRGILSRDFPGTAIFGEEEGETGSGTLRWHVDPLDGTTNYGAGLPDFAVSIGLEDNGKFILGVILQPASGDLYWAEAGKGAFLNGKPIRVSNSPLHESILAIDGTWDTNLRLRKNLAVLQSLFKECDHCRIIGSNALQLAGLAKGSFALSLHDRFHSWDVAAGVVIAKEAGGIVTGLHGEEPGPDAKYVIAANSKETHMAALKGMRKVFLA
ncbi:MAG: inositol monophosphatase [Nanoarchaeota archaeon]